MENIRLTQYSRAAGCGCKIAPEVLEEILKGTKQNNITFTSLLVGNSTADDAAVFAINPEQAIVSTTDFFMPIVDDAFDFGGIAAANAISDVYAMGGKPLMALAILGLPVDKIPVETAREIIKGAEKICAEANIPLAGGHSIDTLEPIFGLSVTGLINPVNLKKNSTAKEGDLLFITKPIGTGILATALKRGALKQEDYPTMIGLMAHLNKEGEAFGKLKGVTAMTDVTGFGLLGHLIEMAAGSGLSAELNNSNIPLIKGLEHYTSGFIFPDNTTRILNSYKDKVEGMNGLEFISLCDPQTNGGLLVSVSPESVDEFLNVQKNSPFYGICSKPIGRMIKPKGKLVYINL
jgi:selenide,water dikinase